MKYKIMIIEDDISISELLAVHLEKYGYEIKRCTDYENVNVEFESYRPDLLLLDINLPMYDGFYWCRKLRAITACPIIFMSARGSDTDQVCAMLTGGDDYVVKPFSFEVLTAKIAAVLRRVYGEYSSLSSDVLTCLDCDFSSSRLTLTCQGSSVELSKTEAGIIHMLFERYPAVTSREELLNAIWDSENFVEENTLNVTISRTRKRLESINSSLSIRSIRGKGYRIGGPEDE